MQNRHKERKESSAKTFELSIQLPSTVWIILVSRHKTHLDIIYKIELFFMQISHSNLYSVKTGTFPRNLYIFLGFRMVMFLLKMCENKVSCYYFLVYLVCLKHSVVVSLKVL